MLDHSLQDIQLAARALLRGRGVTMAAVASLAIGVAANTTVFSLLRAVEFPRLIYPDASRIVFLESINERRNLNGMPVSAPDAADLVAASKTLAIASLTADQSSILRSATSARRVSGRRVTPSFFTVMGIGASLGRVVAAHDAQDAIVVSDRLWRRDLGADPLAVGRPVRLDGGVVTVVGVMPPRFDGDADFWVPLPPAPAPFARDDRQFTLFARLAPRTTIDDATRDLTAISRRLALEHPATNADWTTIPIQLTHMHGRDSRGAFFLLQAAVGLVLLIACANIASILLARGTRRRHEMAVRLSIGATRERLIAALLIESVLLALPGGALGVLLAMWGIRLARASGGFPDVIEPALDTTVLAFTACITILTGILCGIVPALRASSVAPETVLRAEDGRGAPGRSRLRSTLVALEIASAFVLVVCSMLMLRTLANRQRVDLGFDPRGAIRADLRLPYDRFGEPAAARVAVELTLDRLQQLPEIASAGASAWALPTAAGAQRQLTLPSEQNRALPASVRRGVDAVTPGYFAALGASLRAGRIFNDSDRESGAPVAIVNEELAQRLWPNRNPIGEQLRLGSIDEPAPIVTIVGVVSTIRRSAMHDQPVARVYLPFAQYPNASVTLVVRARGATPLDARQLQEAAAAIDSSLFLESVRTVEADIAQFVAPIRLITTILTGFGAAGLLLAALGVFGTMSYTVSQREREMAIRAALGADRRRIFALVFSNAFALTAAGILAGVAAAVGATRALSAFLFGVGPTDPATYAAVIAFLTLVSLAACYRPAQRAATADSMAILRQ